MEFVVKLRAKEPTNPPWARLALPANTWEIENTLEQAGVQNTRECKLKIERAAHFDAVSFEGNNDLYALNFLAERLAGLNMEEWALLRSFVQTEHPKAPGRQFTVSEMLNFTYNLEAYKILPGVGSDAALGRLWGVTLIQTRSPLTEQELTELLDYAEGQMSDGFGEGFEQREIQTPDGDVYVHFWNSKNFELIPEDAFTPSCFCPDYRHGFRYG